jgi:hypothetical protein
MRKIQHFTLTIPSPWRNVSAVAWREIDALHIEHWKMAIKLLRSQTYAIDGLRVNVEVDWRPVLTRLYRDYDVMKVHYPVAGKSEGHERWLFSSRPVRVNATVTSEFKTKSSKGNPRSQAFAESFIYDFFLMMNISAPGSCNFSQATLQSDEKRSPRSSIGKFLLSEIYFDFAFFLARADGWPTLTVLPLDTVVRWYSSIRSGVTQIPMNRMEKVLFAMFHIAAYTEPSPAEVIWVFNAMETLFDTKVGENFRVLVERINLLLSPKPKQYKLLRTKLRELYNLRSAFVHGGLEVAHPMHNEVLDRRVNARVRNQMGAAGFGFEVLLASLQIVINNGWREPIFTEKLAGLPVGP